MQYKAVIFDLDGTLVNTLDDLADAANRILEANGFPTYPVEDYKYFIGDGAETLVKRALPKKHRDQETVLRILHEFRDDYSRNWNVKSEVYEGIHSLLQAVDELGLKRAVLSNKPHEYTVMCIEEYFNPGTFEITLGMRSEVPPKPDPAGAYEITDHLGLKPSECVFLGDSSTDVLTAINAHMLPVGALWGFRTEDELSKAGAKLEISHPMDLMKYLNGK